MAQVVMVYGIGPGIGQSTLGEGIVAALDHGDFVREDDAVFVRPEFAEVGRQFRRCQAREPGAEYPSPGMLEEAYRRLVEGVVTSGRTGVMDWSFIDLAEDLPWAEASLDALVEHSRRVRLIMAPVDPLLFCLVGDIRVGVRRRERDRGREWFGCGALSEEPWLEFVDDYEARALQRHERVMTALDGGGWEPVFLDGTWPKEEVLQCALEHVGSR